MTEKINYALYASSPFDEGTTKIVFDQGWVGYTFGSIFILIGILCLTFVPKARRKSEEYKQRQLEQYNKNRPGKRDAINYDSTGLYLPAWEKIKMSAPLIFGILMVFVGIAWIVGNTVISL